jgi:hypothetical protein
MIKTLAEQHRKANEIDLTLIDSKDYIAKYIGNSLNENECFLFKDAIVLKTIGQYSEGAETITSSNEYKLSVFESSEGKKNN